MSAEKDPARVKGGKVTAAKTTARNTGAPQLLQEYSLLVQPDGTVIDYSNPAQAVAMPAAEVAELEAAAAPELAAKLNPVPQIAAEPAAAAAGIPFTPALDAAQPADVPHETGATKSDMVAELQRLIGLGLSEKEAFTLYMAQLTETPAAPPTPGRQALEERMLDQDRRIEGPDPKMVAEYQERMRTYVPPASDKTYSVTMPVRFAEYVEQWSTWETTKRGRDVTPEDAIQMMVRLHWQADPMRALLAMSGDPHGAVVGTGFDPKTGKFS